MADDQDITSWTDGLTELTRSAADSFASTMGDIGKVFAGGVGLATNAASGLLSMFGNSEEISVDAVFEDIKHQGDLLGGQTEAVASADVLNDRAVGAAKGLGSLEALSEVNDIKAMFASKSAEMNINLEDNVQQAFQDQSKLANVSQDLLGGGERAV